MSNRIVLKAQDANIVKNDETKPGCRVDLDGVDPAQFAAAALTEPALTKEITDRLREQGWLSPAVSGSPTQSESVAVRD